MRRGLLLLVLALGCGGGGGGGGGDGDSDADSDVDADPCGHGNPGEPSVAWVVSGGGPEDDVLSDVAMEPDCRGVVASMNHHGRFEVAGLVAEGGEPWGALVVRFDAGGTPTWSAEMRASGHTLVNALAMTGDGTVWAAGKFEGSGVLADVEVESVGDADAFVARFGPDGSPQTLSVLASTGADTVFAATATPEGGVILAGTFGGPVTVAGVDVDVETPAQDVFVAKFRPDGDAEWISTWGGSGRHNVGYEYPRAVGLGPQGDPVVVGRLANAATPGEWTDSNVAFLTRLDADDGAVVWERSFAWGYGNWGEASLGPLGGGVVAIGGGFDDELDLGDGQRAAEGDAGMLAIVDETGEAQWLTIIDGPANETVRDVVGGMDGEVLALGELGSGVDLGEGAISTSGTDPFLVGAASTDGDITWSLVWAGAGSDDRGTAVDAHPRGRIVVGGEHSGLLRVGGAELPTVGGRDVWVAMLRR